MTRIRVQYKWNRIAAARRRNAYSSRIEYESDSFTFYNLQIRNAQFIAYLNVTNILFTGLFIKTCVTTYAVTNLSIISV